MASFEEIFGEIEVDPKVDQFFKYTNSAAAITIEEPRNEVSVGVTDGTSVSPAAETRRQKIEKIIDQNLKTIFVGNLGVDVVEKQNTKKLLQKFEVFGEIESVRFRSIAFSEKMPRKQAFIAKKLHEGRDSLNAYIVFKDKESAANSIALNGTVFENRHIRVDHSEKKAQKQTDIKRCVFVGNLSFNISDETLWSFFQDCGDIDYVRVVRDHKSNVGKGFGYVQFKERSSVALALKCNGNDVDGRKLRVSKATESEVKKPLPRVLEGTRASRNGSKRFIKPTLAAKKDISKKSRFAKNGAKFADEAIKPKKVKDMIKKPRWRNREMLNKPSE